MEKLNPNGTIPFTPSSGAKVKDTGAAVIETAGHPPGQDGLAGRFAGCHHGHERLGDGYAMQGEEVDLTGNSRLSSIIPIACYLPVTFQIVK